MSADPEPTTNIADALDAHLPVDPGDLDLVAADTTLTKTRQFLRYLQNFTTPVMRLPPEVLCIIFHWVQVIYGPQDPGFDTLMLVSRQFGRTQWIKVLHVCRYWRSVALASPEIWSDICLDQSGYRQIPESVANHVSLYLEHAGNMPLAVDMATSISEPLTIELLDLLPRIRVLRLTGRPSPAQRDLLSTKEAPLLEALGMYTRAPKDVADWANDANGEPFALPTLFNGVHPRLTALSFRVYRRYGSDTFRTVKHLHMSAQRFKSADDIRALLDFLIGLPLLEDLMFSLTRLSETLSVDFKSRRHIISSPHLRRVIFAELPLSFAGLLLQCLDIPHDRHLAIMYRRDPHDDEQQDSLAELTALHVLDPYWNHAVQEAQGAALEVTGKVWYITISGERREMSLKGLDGEFEDTFSVLEGVVDPVSEIWFDTKRYDDDDNYDESSQIPHFSHPWVLKNARNAKKIFLSSDKDSDVFDALSSTLENNEMPSPALEECHVLLDKYGWEEPNDAVTFFKRLSASTAASHVVFHLYHVQPKVVEDWKARLLKEGVEALRTVVIHDCDAFPTIQLSPAFSSPCARTWDTAGLH